MDIETLVGLAFVVIYFILQRAGKNKQKTPARLPGSAPETVDPSTGVTGDSQRTPPATLEDALREIREALGNASRPAPVELPKSRPTPQPVPAPRQTNKAPAVPRRSVDEEFHSLERRAVEPGAREFATGEKFQSTEQGGSLEEASQALSKMLPHSESAKGTRKSGISPSPRKKKALNLTDPSSLREALILSEILGPPRSRRSFS